MKKNHISQLEGLEDKSPDYVYKQLAQRVKDIENLPKEVLKILNENEGCLLDVGPGEGISSMALAEQFSKSTIIGVEMDHKHLVGAWPLCNDYKNLELYWGALPGTPSNRKVDSDIVIPTLDDAKCSVIFSWTGISRHDLFENNHKWRSIVEDTGIFIVPKFWREGSASLGEDWIKVVKLVKEAGGTINEWKGYNQLDGFSEMEVFPLDETLKARGWILWLSGIFDNIDVSFWNTLRDRWKKESKYQLEMINLPLEIIVAKR